MKAKAYFKILKIIQTHDISKHYELYNWIMGVARRKLITGCQLDALMEEYLNGQKDYKSNQTSFKGSHPQMAHQKRDKTRGANLFI